MESLDPRIKRITENFATQEVKPKAPLDQWGTFEVFVQPKADKPFQHEGCVHAADEELAFVLAKETFTRRFQCTSIMVADTRHVFVSPLTEGDQHVYDMLRPAVDSVTNVLHTFEVFELPRRGKQHVHAGTYKASSPTEAMLAAKDRVRKEKVIYNVWAIPSSSIRYTTADEMDFWKTLPEKKFRDASDYKGGDKLKDFLERNV